MINQFLEAYKKMFFIRIAEQEIADYYLKNKVMSFVHFYVGQEAIAVGVADALQKEDKMLGNHRSHGHYLAKGGNLNSMIAELLGKESGNSKGKGGSMHVIDQSVNFVGSTPILGSVIPLSAGSAFQQKYSHEQGITVGYVGDGAFEEGIIYETLNLAALFKLPLLIVLENNLYSVNSKILDRRSPNHSVEKIVTGFGVNYMKADGNDYMDVNSKAKNLIEKIRTTQTPAVLECVTYRHMAHSAPIFDDAQGYREEDVLETRLEKDSLKKLKVYLLENKLITEEELITLETTTKITVLESIQFAVDAKYPDQKELYTNVYAA